MAKLAIFRFHSDPDKFAYFSIKDSKASYDQLWHFKPLRKSWKGIPVEVRGKAKQKLGDFPSLFGIGSPVFSQRALEALQPLISKFAEALPLGSFTGQEYFVIHLLEETDALDETKSKFLMVDGRPAKGSILEYSFHEKLLAGRHIFQIPQLKNRPPLVSKEFKTAIEANGLIGAKFRELDLAG
jgi:hypothetical protein